MAWRKELHERELARIAKGCDHSWASTWEKVGKLFQTCVRCGLVRQVSDDD